jgi:hypothetical protein
MIADSKGKSNRIAGGVQRDRIGKVFQAISAQGASFRQCLVCEGVFTREAAREHYAVRCEPSQEAFKNRRSLA